MIADMSELIRLRPDDALAYYHRGQAYGEQDALRPIGARRLVRSHSPRSRPCRCLPRPRRLSSVQKRVRRGEAIADFDTALRLDPENAPAQLGRGAAYRMKGDLARAIGDFDDALRLKPQDPFAYRFRGDAYVAKGEYDLAIADCNRALKLNPRDPIAFFTRGNAHLFSGKLELALADFNTAVEFDPTSGRSTYGRGLVRQLLGDDHGAEKDFQRARELGYDDRDPECC